MSSIEVTSGSVTVELDAKDESLVYNGVTYAAIDDGTGDAKNQFTLGVSGVSDIGSNINMLIAQNGTAQLGNAFVTNVGTNNEAVKAISNGGFSFGINTITDELNVAGTSGAYYASVDGGTVTAMSGISATDNGVSIYGRAIVLKETEIDTVTDGTFSFGTAASSLSAFTIAGDSDGVNFTLANAAVTGISGVATGAVVTAKSFDDLTINGKHRHE